MRRNPPESLCIEAHLPDAGAAERAAAEAWEAGAIGVEERDEADGSTLLLLYATPATAAAVRAAVAGLPEAAVSEPTPTSDTNWSEAWRRGLGPIVVGERLVVRPSWVTSPEATGPRAELVIDPGQAFGTGGHVSTRLALDQVEVLSRTGPGFAGARVLDVGTGTGVLALAALALGAERAVGFDLDPESGIAAKHWARCNGLEDRFAVFVGPIEALSLATGFDCLLANLLKREMLPIALPMARALRPGGQAVLSGLLAREGDEVAAAFEAVGLRPSGSRTATDPNGDDWISLLMTRA